MPAVAAIKNAKIRGQTERYRASLLPQTHMPKAVLTKSGGVPARRAAIRAEEMYKRERPGGSGDRLQVAILRK